MPGCCTLCALLFYQIILLTKFEKSLACFDGCRCSEQNDVALCCLFPRGELSHNVSLNFCFPGITPSQTSWPLVGSCLPSWRQLQIRLGPFSWSQSIPPVPGPSCAEHLEKLVISSSDSVDDDFLELDANSLRHLLFHGSATLQLRHLVIQQTQLRKINAGFIDQLKAFQLLDLEIIRNPHLTFDGLGVGWLVGSSHLRLLNLSGNRLATISLAKWGFSSNRPSGLLTLDLSGNQISFLKAKSFSRVPNLVKLDLSDNSLTSLSVDVFSGLDNLKVLNLQKNYLTVAGLKVSSSTLASTLPNLRQLTLSNNPLMITNNTVAHWWLNVDCPAFLHQLALEHLVIQHSLPTSHGVSLPPIAWNKCSSISYVFLTGTQTLSCIPQHWLQLAPHMHTIPYQLEILPKSLKLCPPKAYTPLTLSTLMPNAPLAPKSVESDFYAHDFQSQNGKLGLELETDQRQVLGVVKLQGAGFEPWILLLLLSLLFLLVIGVSIWGTVYGIRQCCKRRSKPPKLFVLNDQLNSHMLNGFSHFHRTSSPHSCLYRPVSVLSSRAAYSPLTRSVDDASSQYIRTPSLVPVQSPMPIWNHSDSGMGDVSPAAKQQNLSDFAAHQYPVSAHKRRTLPALQMRQTSLTSAHSFMDIPVSADPCTEIQPCNNTPYEDVFDRGPVAPKLLTPTPREFKCAAKTNNLYAEPKS